MMKATINGIALEGTPEEITEYLRIREQAFLRTLTANHQYVQNNNPWFATKVGGYDAPFKKICDAESCYCTGNCQRSSGYMTKLCERPKGNGTTE